MASKYNAEGYYSPTEYEAFTRMEKEAAAFRPLVYICSPYRGHTNQNIENARRYSRFAVDHHYIPLAPHLLFPQFMDDTLGEDRRKAMFMDLVVLSVCSQVWVFGSTRSEGMVQEIRFAEKNHLNIRYFTEELEEMSHV